MGKEAEETQEFRNSHGGLLDDQQKKHAMISTNLTLWIKSAPFRDSKSGITLC
jgi:hypothetical protein